MRNLLYLTITFLICTAAGLKEIWLGFAAMFTIMMVFNIDKSLLWEIPMGVLACSIIADIFPDDIAAVIRILIPISAVLLGYSAPKHLALFFPVAVCALFLKNICAVAAMWAALWCGVRFLLTKNSCRKHSTIKRKSLQGNNFEYAGKIS